MTERLYYEQTYLKEFPARVVSCEQAGGVFHVVLNKTAFYPTSGGQPHDTGRLNAVNVVDVMNENGAVVHVCDGPLPAGENVRGAIDWERRFDHMQQHAADHMIAGKIWKLSQGYTVGLHLGAEFSTIDIVMPGGDTRFGEEYTAWIEELVNRDVQRDIPIKCFFPSEEELTRLPLRKDPTVDKDIRVVLIGDSECVACGGTHPSSTGQVGPVKILWTAPSRGKLRLAFVAGMRAVRHHQQCARAADGAAALLSAKPDALPDAVQALLDQNKALETELAALKKQGALGCAEGLIERAVHLQDGWRLIAHRADGMDMGALKALGKRLIEGDKTYALLASGANLLFARSAGEGAEMGALLRETAARFSGKGGGRTDFAQGAVEDPAALGYAKEKLISSADFSPQS